jgi:hypothetical protein
MAITWDDVTAFASTLSGVDVDAQDAILAWVNSTLDVSLFGGETGPKLKLARIYLAAHFATAGLNGASSGMVTSETVDGISRSYQPFALTGTGLSLTTFGQLYLALVRTSAARVPLVL